MNTHKDAEGREKDYAQLLDSLSVGVLFVDGNGKIVASNNAVESILGQSKTDLQGSRFSEYFFQPQLLNAVKAILPDSRFEVKKEDGSSSSIQMQASTIRMHGTDHYVYQFYDVTEQKALEDEQKTLMSSIIHDWGNALTVLKSMVDMDLSERPEYKDMFKRSVDRMYRMWDEVREFRELKREAYSVCECEMRAIVDKVIEDYSPQLEKANVSISNRIPDSLRVTCDPGKMARVWDNLVSNAIKYSRGEDHDNQVEIGLHHDDGVREFYIKDNGLGIEPADLLSLGNPYVRLHQNAAEGTGIGLSTVKEILAKHGGGMRIESRGLSMGSTFYIRLPVGRQPAGKECRE